MMTFEFFRLEIVCEMGKSCAGWGKSCARRLCSMAVSVNHLNLFEEILIDLICSDRFHANAIFSDLRDKLLPIDQIAEEI